MDNMILLGIFYLFICPTLKCLLVR